MHSFVMIKNTVYLSLLLIASTLFIGCRNNQQQSNTLAKRVIIIGLDGFSAEGFRKAKHPHIDNLFANGSLSLTTRPVMPSVTLPNWTSHLTGSGPEETGVDGNKWTLKNHKLNPLETDSQGYYPSIFKVLKEHVPNIKIAYYYNWAELINPINKRYLDEISFEENDGYEENYSRATKFAVDHQTEPTFIFLYSVHTDHAGHKYKWMSSAYINAIEKADTAIGRLMENLKNNDIYHDTHFLLITDHGGIENGHGGMTANEMNVPWAITGPGINKQPSMTAFNSNKNTSLVVARLFGIDHIPKSWTGIIPQSIFAKQ